MAKLTAVHAVDPADICHFDLSEFNAEDIAVDTDLRNLRVLRRVFGGVAISKTEYGSKVLREKGIPFIGQALYMYHLLGCVCRIYLVFSNVP